MYANDFIPIVVTPFMYLFLYVFIFIMIIWFDMPMA